jgi:hypothetical protein
MSREVSRVFANAVIRRITDTEYRVLAAVPFGHGSLRALDVEAHGRRCRDGQRTDFADANARKGSQP